LELMHVTQADSGAYILNVNIELHGSVTVYSQRVVLETPDNVTVPSSYYDNAGKYTLIIDNPVASGEYSCHLDESPSAMCLSLLHNGAIIHVNGVETRLSVLEGQLVALQHENAELRSELGEQRNTAVIQGQLTAMQQENTALKHQLNQQRKENENNTAVLEGQLAAMKSELDQQQKENENNTAVLEGQLAAMKSEFDQQRKENENNTAVLEGQLAAMKSELDQQRKENENNTAVLEGQLAAVKSELDQQRKENENNTAVLEGQLTAVQSQVSGLLSIKSILDACDSMTVSVEGVDLNNQPFTTYDHDNDPSYGNCASHNHGAWWYNSCMYSHLNGVYTHNSNDRGWKYVGWYDWNHDQRSFKRAEMKIRLRA
ncbi:hypothetical protein BaRGS_00017712, partial [Batillaria attramentaria]